MRNVIVEVCISPLVSTRPQVDIDLAADPVPANLCLDNQLKMFREAVSRCIDTLDAVYSINISKFHACVVGFQKDSVYNIEFFARYCSVGMINSESDGEFGVAGIYMNDYPVFEYADLVSNFHDLSRFKRSW